jgi:hypothetical protein
MPNMKREIKTEKKINNMTARIKSHYPHLYSSTGGRYIRKVLKNLDLSNDGERHLKAS